jgi:PP-loop superfamily ATP-utilizing enzyme
MSHYLGNEQLQQLVYEKFKSLGFSTVVLDPKGYRMGSLNAALKI